MASQEQDRSSSAEEIPSSEAESHHSAPGDIPFDTIQQYRGMAQENTMNTLYAAQERSRGQDVPDPVYDAIKKAKLQMAEQNNVDSGKTSHQETEHEGESGPTEEGSGGAEENLRQNDEEDGNSTDQSVGGTLAGYVQIIKKAVVGDSRDTG